MHAPTLATFRDHVLSLFQSAAHRLAETLDDPRRAAEVVATAAGVAAAKAAGSPVPAAPPPSSPGDLWTCARIALAFVEARIRNDRDAADRLRSELIGSPCDPGWADALETHLAFFGPGGDRQRIPYVRPAEVGARVMEVSASRVALISDWATGSPEAERLLRQVAARRPDLLIHLGDIYYSGTPDECERKFLRVVDTVLGPAGKRFPVFTLSGNHDMYSGGEGYYRLIGRLNDDPLRQTSSFFCLRDVGGAWQILAMDTGLHDADPFTAFAGSSETRLEPEEEEWHLARLREFGGRTILLSHHPLFSAFRRINANRADGKLDALNEALCRSLRRFQSAGDIAAWFWGHEHNLCIYQPYAGLERGRCVGNGAIPVFVGDAPYRPLAGIEDPPTLLAGTELGNNGAVMHHGFTLLTFGPRGDAAAEYYEQGSASPLYVETFSSTPKLS